VIHEADTEYQYARVVEYPGRRAPLELNEGRRCTRSTPGHRAHRQRLGRLPRRAARGAAPPERIAILGNGGGTTARAYGAVLPRHRDRRRRDRRRALRHRREYFDLRERPRSSSTPRTRGPFLRARPRYDAIFVDAYRQPYIPFYLTTREFFELARDRLARAAW
jgi:spermidine synthase